MTATTDAIATPSAQPWVRIVLIVVAAVETLTALTGFDGMFIDWNHPSTLLRVAQGLTTLKLAAAPLLAGVALIFAIARRPRQAIAALAALILVTWVTDLPSVLIYGWELQANYIGMVLFIHRFIYPVLATAAVVFTARNERLGLATMLVSLPTVIAWLGVLAFAIGVAVYGF